MRLLVLPLTALLAACGDAPMVISNGAAAPAAGEPDGRIDCQPAGAREMAHACTAEVAAAADGRILTLRKADGGFRRLRITGDGRGVAAADGAEPAHVTLAGSNLIEVEIGGDRFRLPARERGR